MNAKFTILPLAFMLGCFISAYSQKSAEIDSLLGVLPRSPDDSNKVNILNRLAKLHQSSDYEKALIYSHEALSLSKQLDFTTGIGYSYRNIGEYYDRRGKYDKAEKNFQNALSLFQEAEDNLGASLVFSSMGIAKRFQGDFDSALYYFQNSLSIQEKLGYEKEMTVNLFNLGVISDYQGKREESITYFLKTLKIHEKLGNKEGVALALNSIGILNQSLKNYEKSETYFQRSLSVFKELGNNSEIGNCLNNLGTLYSDIGAYEKAIYHHQEALEYRKKASDKRGIAFSYSNLASNLRFLKKLEKALEYDQMALKLREEIGDKLGISTSLNNVGQDYRKLKDFQKAIRYGEHSLDIADEIGANEVLNEIYENLSESYAGLNRFEQAFSYHKKFMAIKDSLLNEENSWQMNELQTQYETEKKEKEIALLTKDQEIQKGEIKNQKTLKNAFAAGIFLVLVIAVILIRGYRQKIKANQLITAKNEEIRQAAFQQQLSQLEMKALRAQMNPHFIFNCLSSINRMIMSDESENAARYLNKFSKLIRLILENSEKSTVPLAGELELLETYIQLECERFMGKIEYDISVDPAIDLEATRLPSMVIQPFIENAIWHGLMHKGDKGLVKIFIREENDWLKCVIEDNGIGREKALELKDKKLVKHKSMGMKVTRERLKLISKPEIEEKLIKITDLKDKLNHALGTRIDILIPIS